VLPTVMLALFLIFPTSMGKLKFLPIYKAISIKQNKRLPPHIAFLESNYDPEKSEWLALERSARTVPAVSTATRMAATGPYILTQKRVLSGLVIRKEKETLISGNESNSGTGWLAALQPRSEVPANPWLKSVVRAPAAAALGNNKNVSTATGGHISGPIEISGGLAVTNDHHIEVRRSSDGVFQEMGQVNLQKGFYSIDVQETTGSIVARLVDKGGAVLGEGSIRLSQFQGTGGKTSTGPPLQLSPVTTWTGTVSRYYPPLKGRVLPPPLVTTYGGENKVNVSPSGDIAFDAMTKGSATVVRAEAPGHVRSNRMLVAGEAGVSVPLLPKSMTSALSSLVSSNPVDSKGISAKGEAAEVAMVWGTVKLDGKPLSGVTVQSESDPDAKVVYFNELMIPDLRLKATSTNGMYAFTDIQEGFHALLAQRGDAYFGHQNVLVEQETVSMAEISSTLKTEAVTIKAFDAFTGDPARLIAHLQSVEEPVNLANGVASVVLPQVARMSLIYTENTDPFLKANYFYNDSDTFIHLPMIRDDWLIGLRSEEKINQVAKVGTIVGFVSDESFEVYLAGASRDTSSAVVYFDSAGRRTLRGVPGGGFVIFNAPAGLQEAVVISDKANKILSKVVPVDENSLSVLSFNSY
jgi:hypothetical protein